MMENNKSNDKALLSAKPIKQISKKQINLLSILAAVVALIIWDFADLPLWWQFERRQDKSVILEYVKSNYPDTIVIKGGKFPINLPAAPHQLSTMYFKLNGIDFGISAEYGKIVADGYAGARAIAQFDSIIKNDFFDSRNITVSTQYRFLDNYYDIYPYNGKLSVDITFHDKGATPQDIGCLYDFYKYWESEGTSLKDYQICINIYEKGRLKSSIRYSKSSEYISEDEFNSAFKIVE